MPAAIPLTSAMVATLPRGVPGSVLTVGPVLTVVANVVVTWSSLAGYETFDELTGPAVWLTESLFGALLLGCVSGWWTPRLAGWCAGLISLPDAPVLTATWAVVLVVDAHARRCQHEVTAGWYGDARLPPPAGIAPASHRGLRVFAGLCLLLAAVSAALVAWQARTAVVQMHDRGVETPGRVVAADTFDDSLVVDVDGHAHDFFVIDASSYRPGQPVVVLVDPEGVHRPVGFGDFDPEGDMTFALMLLGALAAAGAVTPVVLQDRWRRARRLAEQPGPALVVSLALHERFVEVYPVDASPDSPAFLRLGTPMPGRTEQGTVDRLIETWERIGARDPVDRGLEERETFLLRGFRGHGDVCLVHADDLVVAMLRPARDAHTLTYLAQRWWARVAA